jgi:hypothetical protein
MSKELTPQQKRQHTQWGTQFRVAAELERLGYTVAFTMGHSTAVADLMVGLHNGDQFWVDVKGLRNKNSWNLRPNSDWGKKGEKLFYVLVLFPPAKQLNVDTKDRFFILTQKEANELVRVYKAAHPKDKGKAPGFSFEAVVQFENCWEKLPCDK